MSETNKTFNFELVSPEAKLISEPAWQVLIPGEEGHMGVRAGHTSLVATIKPGIVEIWKSEGDKPQKIFIAGGFADITADNLTVLAEEAEDISLISVTDLDQQIQNLKDDIGLAKDEANKSKLEKQLQYAKLKRAAVSG